MMLFQIFRGNGNSGNFDILCLHHFRNHAWTWRGLSCGIHTYQFTIWECDHSKWWVLLGTFIHFLCDKSTGASARQILLFTFTHHMPKLSVEMSYRLKKISSVLEKEFRSHCCFPSLTHFKVMVYQVYYHSQASDRKEIYTKIKKGVMQNKSEK